MPLPFLIAGIGAVVSTIGAGAAAVGTIAAGTAAAAGTVAAGTAAAVGGAAAAAGTAAAAVGTAVAGTAAGSAAIGAMSAVGTAVGTAAAAASSAPVIGAAAATIAAADAAAVGTIATTGAIGAVTGISGAAKLAEAEDIKDSAMCAYNEARRRFEKTQAHTNSILESLGEDKLKIWNSFNRFTIMFSKIQNPPRITGEVEDESLTLTPDELDNIKAVAIKAKDLLVGGLSSVGAGNLIGLAASGGIISTISVASTGTAISALSGAAATNATLAALGGGSLAAGGGGMAGGAAVLGGLTLAPMLMAGGIMLNGKGRQALESAKDISYEADQAVEKMSNAEVELNKVAKLAQAIQEELKKLNVLYLGLMEKMESIVARETSYLRFTDEERRTLDKTVLSVMLLKTLSLQNILDPETGDKVLESDVKNALDIARSATVGGAGMAGGRSRVGRPGARVGNS